MSAPTDRHDLTTLEQAEDAMDDLVCEPWEDNLADAFTQALLGAAGATVYGPRPDDDDASYAASVIMSAVEDASNARSEVESMDDSDGEYEEASDAYDEAYAMALERLHAFWERFIAGR